MDMRPTEFELDITEDQIPVFRSAFDNVNFPGHVNMHLVYNARDRFWKMVLVGANATQTLEFCANVYVNLETEMQSGEDLTEDEPYTENHESNFPAGSADEEDIIGEMVEDGLISSEEDEEEDEELEDKAAEEDEEEEPGVLAGPSSNQGRVVKLKRPKTVQKSGAISVEED